MIPLDKVTLYRSARHGSGRSSRSSISSVREPITDIDKIIKFHAERNGISESLVRAVIKAESGGDPRAQSRCGACGLMQLMPGTAAEMGIYDLFDPDENIAGGAEYLSKMLELFGGRKELALAAYNAGPGAVKKYGGVPPFSETRNYVQRVLRYEQDFQRGVRLQIASATDTNRPTVSARTDTNPNDFAITTKNGITIRGTSYKKLASGIQIKTSRKWEFVPNDSIRNTNFS
ncbi:MAG: lytic transglycosylase domain-containing protein [Candidatus Hydrogenedentes bacterium]|nr:lytic transglycosylase domain-containing protein [Candidatus Hydrogenedentota bacterium]